MPIPQVFRLEDSCCLFTLQGHSGAITAVYIDQVRTRAGAGERRGPPPGPGTPLVDTQLLACSPRPWCWPAEDRTGPSAFGTC